MKKLSELKHHIEKKTIDFKVDIIIHGCTNIPSSSGKVFCKWKIKSKTIAFPNSIRINLPFQVNEAISGLSNAVEVVGNKAIWHYKFSIPECKLTVDQKTNIVNPYTIRFSIRQEKLDVDGFNRIGIVNINIAEYVGSKQDTRRYLLEECSFNSTLQISVNTEQIAGDPMFKCPESTARVEISPNSPSNTRSPPTIFTRTTSSSDVINSRESVFGVVEDIVRISEINRDKKLPSK